jgi:hypothetical protein
LMRETPYQYARIVHNESVMANKVLCLFAVLALHFKCLFPLDEHS